MVGHFLESSFYVEYSPILSEQEKGVAIFVQVGYNDGSNNKLKMLIRKGK